MAAAAALKADTPVAQVSRFVQSLQEPRKAYISAARFSKALGINLSGMARLTGVHRNTMRNPASDRLQERLREIIKVISAATAFTGDIDKAIFWFRNEPIGDYQHETAAELVAKGHVEAVLAYLRDLEGGASG
jgi:DNA-binding phage protein